MPTKLTHDEIRTALAELPAWVVEEPNFVLRRQFSNFAEALAYVNRLGELAEAANHHPDITFGWGYAEIRLTTHDAGGITSNDVAMAKKIDGVK